VAQPEKDDFNFDDFQFSGVGLTPKIDPLQEVPAAGSLAPDSLAAEPVNAEMSASASEVITSAAVGEDKKAKKKSKKEKKVKEKKIVPAEDFSDGKKKSALLRQLTSVSPYTVLLGMTLVALLLAGILLFIEWTRYDMDTHATKAKQSIVMNSPATAPFAGHSRFGSEIGSEQSV
jgi:hypothetical protein